MGDQVRLRQKTIQQGLKPKLRNDRFGEPHEIVEVLSPQNIKIKWNNKTKIVNVNNVKPKELERTISKTNLGQGSCSNSKETKQLNPGGQPYFTKFGRQIRPRV